MGTPGALEQKFADLLASFDAEFSTASSRPTARDIRLAEEILAAFLDVSGEQLVRVLKGETTFSPLHQLEVLVSLFYGTIDDAYVGVDSHPPSVFLKVHPFLLETLTQRKREREAAETRSESEGHSECHALRKVRIVPFSAEELQADVEEHPEIATDYFSQHEEPGVWLLSVERGKREEARNEALRGQWTGDIGLWLNTAALLFAPNLDAVTEQLQLELVYPSDRRFQKCLRYVRLLIEQAKVVRLRGRTIEEEEMPDELREHLLWDLETMFEPDLADSWDEFVAAPKRIDALGPFVDSHIQSMDMDRATVLDAATGTGCESIYLLQQGHDVTSNEIEHRLIAHARESASKANVDLRVTRFDWRHLEHLDEPESYDVVLALGNSLSCLPTEADVRMVLARFALLLRPNGVLIADERNYPLIFKNQRKMLRKSFRFPGRVVYCSDSIQARPKEIPKRAGQDNKMLTLEYLREDGTMVGRFEVLPFAEDQLEGLLFSAGFRSVERFYNLKEPNGGRNEAEFITYVASRALVEGDDEPSDKIDAVVAFIDVDDSLATKGRLGETQYAIAWGAHEEQVRKTVGAYEGEVVNDTGDGFLLCFLDAGPAVECMRDLVGNPGTDAFSVRAGINQGIGLHRNAKGNLRGQDVDVAARICDHADPETVFVEDRVMLMTREHDWTPAGRVKLKGTGTRHLWVLGGQAG